MRQLQLNNKTYKVESLPSETSLLVELINLCHDDAATFETFESTISKDPGLTTKILAMAHTPSFRQWNDLKDLRQILIVFGMSSVKKIVIAVAIKQFFANFSHEFNLHVQTIWIRSLICSNLTTRLAKMTGYDQPGQACLSGLLAQVGQLLFLFNDQAEYPKLLLQYPKSGNFCQLEQNQLETDHCELGAALIESWEMAPELVEAVRFQHASSNDLQDAPLLSKLLSVASALNSGSVHIAGQEGVDRAGQLFNLTQDTVLSCFAETLDLTQKMVTDLGYDWDVLLNQQAGDQTARSAQLLQTEKSLAEQVKEIALTRGSLASEENDICGLLAELRSGFGTLFSLYDLIYIQAEPRSKTLRPINDLHLNVPRDFKLSCGDSQNLIAKCFCEGQRQRIQRKSAAKDDQMLLELIRGEQGYAFPVHAAGETAGVLLLGLNDKDAAFVENNFAFVELLIKEFARSLQHLLARPSEKTAITYDEFQQIAHEVTNPLSILKNYLYLLKDKLNGDPDAREHIQFMNEEIKRAGDILLRAKDSHRSPDKAVSETLNINEIISSLNEILDYSHYQVRKIESSLQLDPGIPPLQGRADQFKQVLLNLLKNSIEAMTSGGRITISSRDRSLQNGQEFVEITIKDNGPGIPEQVLQQLFKPVDSTKSGHSGLGLSIAKNLISDLGGEISCYSRPGAGTEFKIFVPRQLPLSQGD